MSELTDRNAHIPTAEVEQDIADTQREIVELKSEIDWLEKTPQSSRDFRLNMIKAQVKRDGIQQREKFIGQLEEILRVRRGGSSEQQP